MRKSVVYIISDIDKALAFEWVATYLDKQKFDLSFILISPKETVLEKYIHALGLNVYRVISNGKKDWPKAIFQVYGLLRKINPAVIHCHLIQANIIGLTAGKLAGVKKRIYTRHHSSFHHVYFPKGVLWDKLSNILATHIVAISGNVKDVLINWEKADENKVTVIPHGFLLNGFLEVPAEGVISLKKRHNLEDTDIGKVIGVISRYTELKGIQYIIPAFKNILKLYPDSVLVLANATGDYKSAIQELLKEIPERNYREITFESDIMALYKLFDVFVHVPIDSHSEAFGQTYVEALAAGIPSVFTLSGIANEFIKDQENALVVDYQNAEAIYIAILQILENEDLRNKLIQNGRKEVFNRFGLERFIQSLEELYL
ncbi:glycosyltransferase family 4 protein [Adhaeribacter aerolatus]|uniref:glycosyltransferase family 4 protein n=1 Tax=Adhaeribacter aerolatus TaxID=670289 RepID=UPI0011BF4295|nr:glycosyltransferase family 4 protein [Adhaeribacter aerolatus]